MRVVIALFCGICILVATPPAQSWNKAGHMTAAAIAYADLKERNPEVLARVVQLLVRQPHFVSKWQDRLAQVPQEDRDLYLFMLAARWPDDVRKKYPQYDRPAWHSVKIPYRPGKEKVKIPDGDSIVTAFPKNRSIAKSTAADDKARSVAVCWIFHLIGDVHQPLHTIKLVTKQFPEPKGDRGGSGFYVRVTPSSPAISLHKLWDGLVLGSDKFQAVRNKATSLRNKPRLKRTSLSELLAVRSFRDWVRRSYTIAVEQAYRKGTLQGSTSREDGVPLPDDYLDKAKETAERQLVLSGYRISDEIVALFGR
jgi:S1/P1 Nuclease